MVQDRATFTMADQYGLLNGAIFTVKHTKVRTAAYKKTMLMHKIATPQPAACC